MSGKKSIVASPRSRRRSLAVEIKQSLSTDSARANNGLFFEPLEPRILLSADGLLPMPLDIGLLDTVTDVDPAADDLGKMPSDLEQSMPAPETGHVDPDQGVTEPAEFAAANDDESDSSQNSVAVAEQSSADESAGESPEENTNPESGAETDSAEDTNTAVDDSTASEGEPESSASAASDADVSAISQDLSEEIDSGLDSQAEQTQEVEDSLSAEPAVTESAAQRDDAEPPALQIVFIDKSIEDYSSLLDGISANGAEVVFGDPDAGQNMPETSQTDQGSVDSPASTFEASGSEPMTLDSQASQPRLSDPFIPHQGQQDAPVSDQPQVVVYFIDSGENGIELIADRLSTHQNVDAVHILSHGAAGMVNLGNARLNSASLDRYGAELDQWGDAMADGGDLYLYGCDVAGTEQGVQFVEDIALHIGANVAASNDATGSVLDGGDFDFEVLVGDIDSNALFSASAASGFSGVLPAEQLVFVMSTGQNAVSISSDGTDITISDGVDTSVTLIADITDILITGLDSEDDVLTVDFATFFGLNIVFDGGAGGNDSLIIDNGTFETVTYTATASDSGDIAFATALGDTVSITYSGLEPVTDNSTAADRVFTGTAGANNIQLTDADAGSTGQSIIQDIVGGTFESITFNNPTNSLVIDGGAGNDLIDISATQDDGLVPAAGIEIRGGGDDDTLQLDAASTLPSGITFDGGGGSDSIEINNGSFASASYTSTAAGAGDIELVETDVAATTTTLSYAALESVTDNSVTADLTYTGSAGADTIELTDADAGTTGQSLVDSDVDITFNNPSNSVTINGGDGADNISLSAAQDADLVLPGGIALQGGSDDDTINLDLSAALPGNLSIDGGAAGSDTLAVTNGSFDDVVYTLGAADGEGNITFTSATDGSLASYTNLEVINDQSSAANRALVGSDMTDTLSLADADLATTGQSRITSGVDILFNNPTASLSIETGDGADSITLDAVLDAGLAPTTGIALQGGDGDDTINLDLSTTLPGNLSIDGGAASTDTLVISNGSFDDVVYTLGAADGEGNITFTSATDGSLVDYSNLEVINDQSSAVNRVLVGSDMADTVTLTDADLATTGQSQIASGVDIRFTNPTGSLSIETGDGADIVDATGVQDSALILPGGLTLDGGMGDDEVLLSGNPNFISTLFNFETVEVDGDDESDIDTAEIDSGLTAFATFMGRLSQFGEFDVELPLTDDITVGGVSGLQEIIAQLRSDLLSDANFNGSATSDPSLANFEVFLQAWAPMIVTPLGNITVTTSGITPTIVEVQNGNTLISRSVNVTATREVDLVIENTDELVEANIALDSGTSSYTADVLTELSFTLGSDVTNDNFITQISRLDVAASGNDIDLSGDLIIGVLDGSIDIGSASYSLSADIDVTFSDPGADGDAVSLDELLAANAAGSAGNLAADALVDINGSGEFELSFDFTPDDGFAAALGGTINVGGSTYELFEDYGFGAPVDLGSDDLYGLSLLEAGDLVTPLQEFAQWLNTLTGSGLYDSNLQLADGIRIGDLLDYDGLLRSDIIDILRNPADGALLFDSIQDINDLIATAYPTDSPLTIAYDAVNRTLGVSIDLDRSGLTSEADFDYNLLLDSLSSLESDATVNIDTAYGLVAEFRFDLEPADQPTLVPGAANASAQSGQLSQDVTFSLQIGATTGDVVITAVSTAANTSITDLLVDVNSALDAAFGAGVVSATADTTLGAENPRLLLTPAIPTATLIVTELSRIDGGLLGLVQGPFDVERNSFINSLPEIDISGGSSDFEFALEIDGVRTSLLSVAAADTAGLVNATDLVALFDAALTGLDVSAGVEDGRLVLTADAGASVNTLRILAQQDNPVLTVLGFNNAQVSTAEELASAYFEASETVLDATIRTEWSDTDATGQFGFVEFDFTEAAAQSTLTLTTGLMDSVDGQVALAQFAGDLGQIVDGPVSSGSLSTTDATDPDYVTNDALRGIVAAAGDSQFGFYLDGYVAGEAQIDTHRLTISATQAAAFGQPDLGLENAVQELVSAPLSMTLLDDGNLSGNAVFTLTVNDTDSFSVSVDTSGNNSSIDLLDDINQAIESSITTAELGLDVDVRLLENVLVFTDSAGAVVEVTGTNLVARDELGLSDGAGAERVVFTDVMINPSVSFEGRPLADVSFDVQIDNAAPVNIIVSQSATSDNLSEGGLVDLVTDVNAALLASTLAGQVEARVVASRLVLVNLGAADTQLRVSASKTNTVISGDSVDIFRSLSSDVVANALVEFGAALDQTDFEDDDTGPTAFLDAAIPLINQTGLEINDYITAFSQFADQVTGLGGDSIQDFEQSINELLGLDHTVVSADSDTGFTEAGISFSYGGSSNQLGVDLVFEQEAETEFDYFIDAYSLASLIADGADTDSDPDVPAQIDDDRVVIRDPLGAIELVAESLATIDLSLTIDLANDDLATVLDTTRVDLDIRVDEDELNFQAKVGSTTLFVQDGSIVIDADGDAGTDDFLNIATTFEQFDLDGSAIEPGIGDEFLVDLTGEATVIIPLFSNASVSSALPSADDPDVEGAPLTFNLVDLAAVITETEGSVEMPDSDNLPDLVPLVSSGLNNLLSDPSLLIDGLDNILNTIQTAIEVPIQGLTQIPLIGDQIDDALQPFLDQINQARIDLNEFLLGEYAEAVSGGSYDGDLTLILQEALYDLFAGSGDLGVQLPGEPDGNDDGEGPRLGLLQDLGSDGNATVGFEDILVNQFNDIDNSDEGIQYDFHLGQSYSISVPFELGLGTNDLGIDSFLPGFGFEVGSEEGVTIDISWDLRIGFGISTQDLFYISTVHYEDISDAGSDYAEELILALDVSVPGFEADVNLGLVGAEITDGVEGPATLSSLEKITLFNSGISNGSVTLPSSSPIDAGEFNLLLYSDSYNSDGEFVSADTSPTVVDFDISAKTGLDFLDRAIALIGELNLEGFGDVLVTPDLSQIDFLNPNFGLTFTALDPDVTRIEFQHVDGNNFGFGSVIEDENGMVINVLDQYEDQRATGLGFANVQNAVGGVIEAPFEAPVDGILVDDILFTLMVSGQEVEVSVRAASLDDEVDNPDMDADPDTDDATVGGVEALALQLQDSLDLALGEAGLASGDVEVSLVPDGTSGQFFFRLEGSGLQSIEWNTLETSSVSLKFAVDLFGDVAAPGEETPFDPLYDFIDDVNGILNPLADDDEQAPNLDRPRLTLPELIGSPQTSIYTTLEGDAELRLHVSTNTNAIDEFIDGLVGLPTLGLPSIDFDLKAGIEGTLILFGQVDPDMPADEAFEFEINDIDFDNIQVDLGELLGTFLRPTLGAINTVLGPVFDIIGDGADATQGFLNEPIPLISDISSLLGISDDFSWLDLTGNKDSFNLFFDVIQQATDLLDAIDNVGQTGIVNLGGWRLVMDDESPFYFPNTKLPVPISVVNAYDGVSQEEVNILQLLGVTASGSPIPEPGGFTFELLDPANIFKLITGDNFDIFSFNLPKLELELGIDFGFDFDVLEFAIDGGLSVAVDLGIGYDSTGLDRIRQAREEGAPIDGADLLDGFFIRTIQGGGPEIELTASFAGGGGVDIHTPSFCIDLGFLGSACFPRFDIFVVNANINAEFSLGLDVRDPNEDGKLRFDEILDITNGFDNPENVIFLFDIVGSASGSFDISGTVLGVSLSTSDLGLGQLGFSLDFSAQDFFASVLGLPDPFAPIIAERLETVNGPTGVVRINAGEFAYARLYGDTNDFTGANVSVASINGGSQIRFTDNTTGSFTDLNAAGIDSIIFRGVDARDIFNASGLANNISLDIRGNGGNDSIVGGAGADIIRGNGGHDTLRGSGGIDTLFGELGNDSLFGGGNTDLLSGGKDNDTLAGGNGGDVYLYQTTAGERGGFGQDLINETEIESAFVDGRVLSIASVQQQQNGTRILITAENHGLQSGNQIVISGVVGVANANGTVTIDRVDDNSFLIRDRQFVGTFDADNGAGYIVDTNVSNLDQTRSPAFNQLTDTIDLREARSSQSIAFVMDTNGTRVSFVEETVAVNTITHTGRGIETLLGGDGNDIYQISANGNGAADHFTNLDGGEGSDQYEIRIGNLQGDINIQDTGLANATDTLFVFGRDDAADGDVVGLTNQIILFDIGRASENAIAYSPVGGNGEPVESGLEVIQLDLLQGDDEVRIESTPTASTVTVNGGLGSDVFNVGVNAATGAETNLNDIDGTEENGTLKLFGNSENPALPENADDIDQLRFFDTTDTTDNNAANGTNGLLGFNADTGIGSLEGLGITIGVEFGGIETVDLTLGEGDDELLVLGTVSGDEIDTGITSIFGAMGEDIIDISLITGSRLEVRGQDDNDIITLLSSASANIFLFGDDGDDEINLTALSSVSSVMIAGGAANDTINVGSRRSSSDAGLGSVNDIDGMITITGDGGLDTLIVDDSMDTAGNNAVNGDSGVLTNSSLTGLGFDNGIGSYTEFEQVYIHTGSGNDEVNVQSTDVDAITLIDVNAGDDAIVVSSTSPTTDGNLDLVEGDLVLHGGDGTNALLISDIGTAMADDNVVMDEADFDPLRPFIRTGVNTVNAGDQNHHFISGLAGQSLAGAPYTTGTIYYAADFDGATGDFHGQDAAVGGVTVRAGNEGNSFQINSVYSNDLTTLYTGQGNDTVVTGDLSSTVSAANPTADGNLLVYGQQGADSVDASLSTITVTLDGGAGDDVLFGGSATDLIVGGADGDYLDGGDGDDLIYGDSTVTLDLDAQTTSRTTVVSDGKDFLIGAGGTDDLYGELGNDVLYGDNATAVRNGAGVITSIVSSDPVGTEQTLTSSGGAGATDQLFGETGDDILVGGAGQDQLQGNEGQDIIFGDNARIVFEDMAGMSNPLSVESTDTDSGDNDTIFGDTEGSEDGQDDIVFGGIGDDMISGQGGNDILFGDNGRVVRNDGSADANDLLSTAGDDFGADTISGGLGEDILIGDHANVVRNAGDEVETISSTFVTGADDILSGDSENDTIVGGLGADQITGAGGDDIILGDQGVVDVTNGQTSTSDPSLGGNDVIDGGEGNNQVLAGNGRDNVTTGSGDDIIVGDNGTTDGQTTTSTDFDQGADDIIDAGEGNNVVIGGAANDRIITGGGMDIVIGDSGTTDGSTSSSLATGIGGNDNINSGAGDDEVIGGAAMDTIDSGSGNDAVLGDSGVTDGTTTTTIDAGVGGNDVIVSGSGNDEVIGGAGMDNINSGSGNDAVLGDSGTTNGVQSTSSDFGVGGNDVIDSGTGNDEVIGGAGNDTIDSGTGNDAVLGDSGTTNGMTSSSLAPAIGGNDTITTGLGDDQVIGGVGADNIMTGAGADSILGDNGITTGDTTTSTDPAIGGDDIIDAGEGENQVVAGEGSDMITSGDGDDAILGDNGTTDGDTSESTEPNIGGDDIIDAGRGRNQVIGGDGRDEIESGSGNDVVLGDSGITTNNTATSFAAGSGGDDTIVTGAGNDLVVAGAGNDNIETGAGNDAVIGDSGTTNGSTTTSSAPGTGGNDMIDTGSGNDQVIGGAGSDNINSGTGDDAVLGDNGTTNGSTTTSSSAGIGGNDTIVSGAGSDQVIGGAGGDNIDVGSGNDVAIGDSGTTNGSSAESNAPSTGGNDTINASGGNNQVIGGAGGDNINTGNGRDVILGDNGRTTRATAVSASPTVGGNDNISSGGGLDLVIGGVGSDRVNGGGGNDSILGDNGVLTLASVRTNNPTVGGNDVLEGGSGDDAILGGAGSDQIGGGAGNDRILGDNGFWEGMRLETTELTVGGNDSISGGADNDWILGGFGDDNIRGDGGFDVLLGDNGFITPLGNNIFKAATTGPTIGGNDVIDGGPGNDILIGGFGNDTLIGNLGEDILIGDNGVVIFSLDGTIIQVDSFGTDPLDRSASFNLYARDLDIDYAARQSTETPNNGLTIADSYALQQFELGNGHRFLHHHVPMEIVEDADQAEPATEQQSSDDDANPVEESATVDPATNAEPQTVSATAAANQVTPELLTVTSDRSEQGYIGAASIALYGWHRRNRQVSDSSNSINNDSKGGTRVFDGFRRTG